MVTFWTPRQYHTYFERRRIGRPCFHTLRLIPACYSRRLLPMNSQPGFLTPRSRPLVKCDSLSHLCRPRQTPHLTHVPCNLEAPEDFWVAHPYQGSGLDDASLPVWSARGPSVTTRLQAGSRASGRRNSSALGRRAADTTEVAPQHTPVIQHLQQRSLAQGYSRSRRGGSFSVSDQRPSSLGYSRRWSSSVTN